MKENSKLVWIDGVGDVRKKEINSDSQELIDENKLIIEIRRLTSGKGRTIIELSSLPDNKKWCQKLAKDLKKKLGSGGAYKNNIIEIHGEQFDKIVMQLDQMKIKWKKI